MTYSVHQHWDPLKVCIVGKSYPPEFYSFINNSRVRRVMERIAYETEEDYQKLIKLLESFGVKTLRPDINPNFENYRVDGIIIPPPMTPCDLSIMIGDTFYHNWHSLDTLKLDVYADIADSSWPIINSLEEFNNLSTTIQDEVLVTINSKAFASATDYSSVLSHIKHNSKNIVARKKLPVLNRAMVTRVGKDLYVGTEDLQNFVDDQKLKSLYAQAFPEYRVHVVDTKGHSDGSYCPVVPGLIVSLRDIPTYKDTFPGWEVVYLPGQSWAKVEPFLELKKKNKGKWWVPGEELNDEFTEFIEGWLNHWVGYVEETVFDVNMLVIDEKNVVVNNYNEQVFRAFDRYGITPHVVNFRHRYFWDGGLHCITSDVHREGTMKDYFPERG